MRKGSTSTGGRKFAHGLCFLLLAFYAGEFRADLISQGATSRDTVTGLEWLDGTQTLGLSYYDILADRGGWIGAGWRYADADELCDLVFRYAGVGVPGRCLDSPRRVYSGPRNETLFDRALMDALGTTVFQLAPNLWATESTSGCFQHSPNAPGLGFLSKISGGGFEPFDQYSFGEDRDACLTTASDFRGHYLVRAEQPQPPVGTLFAAVLPGSRSVAVGTPASALATIINPSQSLAVNCRIEAPVGVPASFSFQATDPASNAPVTTLNAAASIPAGGFRTFVFQLTPDAAFAATEVAPTFVCDNSDAAAPLPGVNTLVLSASVSPPPDVIALARTPSQDGIVALASETALNAFAAATINVGAEDLVSVQATADPMLLLTISWCATNATTGNCEQPATPTDVPLEVRIPNGGTPTFSFFVQANGSVPFDPVNNRIRVEFRDSSRELRGLTSVAVRTP